METPMGVWYCTREDVKSATDSAETARNNDQVDDAIEAASRSIESLCLRKFYPQIATRYFDFPNTSRAPSYRLWLDENELTSVSALTSAGDVLAPSSYFLRPDNDVVYGYIELDRDSTSSWATDGSGQRDITITGTFGYPMDSTLLGAPTVAFLSSAAEFSFANSQRAGVGSLLKIGDEILKVTGKTWSASAATVSTDITAKLNATSIVTSSGAAFKARQVIMIESEKMLITDITSNTLIVKRAWDGTEVAAHVAAGATIYTQSVVQVDRAQLGTASIASTSANVYLLTPPGDVKDLCVAEALWRLQRHKAGQVEMIQVGNTRRLSKSHGPQDLRDQVVEAYGRRTWAR